MKTKLLSFLAIVLLSGCVTPTDSDWKVNSTGTIDKSKKIMFAKKGSKEPLGTIKKTLIDDGWKIVTVRTDNDITKGTIEGDVYLERREVVNAYYELSLRSFHTEDVNVSITDLLSGEEILTIYRRESPKIKYNKDHYAWLNEHYKIIADNILFYIKSIER